MSRDKRSNADRRARLRRARFVAAMLVGALALAACGADEAEEAVDAPPAEPDAPSEAPAEEPEDIGFPTENVIWVVPANPGGGQDTGARQLAPYWEELLGVNIVVENHAGGNFAIGSTIAAQADPDCHTILNHIDPIFHFSHLLQDVDYSYDNFYPIARHTSEPSIFIVRNDAPWETLEELLEDAQNRPGEIVAAAGGLTSTHYVGFLDLEDSAGVEFNIVPFDSGGDARQALLSGEADVGMGGVFNALPISDEIRILGITAPENEFSEYTANARTVREILGDPDFPNNHVAYGVFVQSECHEQYPERVEFLERTFIEATQAQGYLDDLAAVDEQDKLAVAPGAVFHEQMLESLRAVEQVIAEQPAFQQ